MADVLLELAGKSVTNLITYWNVEYNTKKILKSIEKIDICISGLGIAGKRENVVTPCMCTRFSNGIPNFNEIMKVSEENMGKSFYNTWAGKPFKSIIQIPEATNRNKDRYFDYIKNWPKNMIFRVKGKSYAKGKKTSISETNRFWIFFFFF